ncbi:unnamed protein product [Caenorhabditis auriculariae]|uniref:LITAF domain-containing protein n=1 Tax=Caenorhabditis auriculariae TaxID=2777116 RepID=A0A8S1HML1_9PELO|nr:unnamed protein product [Caenorhabditis auriculariae]
MTDEKVNPTTYENQAFQTSNPPPSYTEASTAPQYPPVGAGVHPVYPPGQQPNVVVYTLDQPQQVHVQPTVVVVRGVKTAPSYDPYLEYCPKCKTNVVTNTHYEMGFCSWLMLFLGIFLFFPLLCCFCLKSFKDARHFCPNCGTLLSVKRR